MIDNDMIEALRRKFTRLASALDEHGRRRWAASEALELGHGGIKAVAQATGLGERTVRRGCQEVRHPPALAHPASRRIRRAGGGRKALQSHDPALVSALEALVDPTTRGDPMSPLRWTCNSTRQLAKALGGQGHQVSHTTVAQLLADLDYSLQGTRKTLEGTAHPDRDAQFRYINRCVKVFQRAGQPVIAVEAKKQELVGQFAKGGRDYQPTGQPERVKTPDFPDKALGKICPYGVYDQTQNHGWVSVGIDHDTAQFAVESIRRWWNQMGRTRFPGAERLLITADAGGSNGYRLRAWKVHLATLAAETGLAITVCHYPPGTSKWNRIEHRMFSFITNNWRGRPLISLRTIIELISATATATGLTIQAGYDPNLYTKGVKITDTQLAAVPLDPHDWHGEWNYTINAQSDLA